MGSNRENGTAWPSAWRTRRPPAASSVIASRKGARASGAKRPAWATASMVARMSMAPKALTSNAAAPATTSTANPARTTREPEITISIFAISGDIQATPEQVESEFISHTPGGAQSLLLRRERGIDRGAKSLEDLHPRPLLVVGFDQMPRREGRARTVDHVTDGLLVSVPFAAVAPVFPGKLEPLECGLLARAEACELLLFAEGEPELHDHDPGPRQGILEVDNLAVCAHPVRLGGETFDSLDEDPPVPAPVEERDMPLPRDMPPEPPE